MMIPGQRVELDLGSDDEEHSPQQPVSLPAAFVGDVLERQPSAPRAPSVPSLKNKSGFPEHKKRDIESRFTRKKAVSVAHDKNLHAESRNSVPFLAETPSVQNTAVSSGANAWEKDERRRIDEENRQKLADMSPAEIEEERQELMDSLSPAFLQRLLRRSNIDSGSSEADLNAQPREVNPPQEPGSKTTKSVSFVNPPQLTTPSEVFDGEEGDPRPSQLPQGDAPGLDSLPAGSIHFPQPQQPPELDPASATFFEDLHTKYFPALPAEPDKLAWMQASKAKDDKYNPSAAALTPRDLRFSFTGELIPPKTAAEIPVTMGLHHHADSPDAAGYTIPELAHLSRSTYPAQRCIAFQTLGRILYRLGKGEFGDSGEPGAELEGAQDTFGELARSLWSVVEGEKVIETLVLESEGKGVDRGRHISAKAYATEAVWLWRKGGGRRWKAA